MAIITVPANPTVRPIHDRMPAVLAPEHFEAWLDCRSGDTLIANELLKSATGEVFEIREVSRRLNNPRNDGPELWQSDTSTLL